MTTFTQGEYTAEVTDDHKVKVTKDGILFDHPGPWADHDSAAQWAEAIVGAYATGQIPTPTISN